MANDVILDWFDDATTEPTATPGLQRDEQMISDTATSLVTTFRARPDMRFTSDEEAGFLENMWNGARHWGAIAAGGDFIINGLNGVPGNEVDASWGGMIELPQEAQGKAQEFIQLSKSGSRAAHATVRKLIEAKNQENAMYWLEQGTKMLELERKVDEAPFIGGYGIGAATGMGIDILAMIFAGGGVTAPNAFGRLMFQGGNAMVRNTQAGQRLVAGARIAAVGAAEAGVQETVQALRDVTVDEQDIWTAMGFGAVAGGLIGSAGPRMFGKVFTREQLQEVEERIGQEFAERAASLSAAAPEKEAFEMATEIARDVPGRGAGGLGVAKRVPGLKAWRNPKNVIREMGIKGAKENAEEGLEGNLTAWQFMQSLWKSAAATEGEMADQQVRQLAYSEIVREMDDALGVHEVVTVKGLYDDMMAEVYNVGTLQSAVINDELAGKATQVLRGVAKQPRALTQQQFNDLASTYAKIRQADLDDEVPRAPDFLDSLPAMHNVAPEKAEAFKNYVKTLADKDDEFFSKWADRGARVGLLNGDDIKPGYRPQNWLIEDIRAHSSEFKMALRMVFGRSADETFANEFFAEFAEKELKEGVEAELKPLIDIEAGETMQDLARKNPGLYNEINRAYDEAVKGKVLDDLNDKAWLAKEADEVQVEKSRVSMIERNQINRAKAEKRLVKMEAELDGMPARWTRKRAALAERITELEHTIGKYRDRIRRAEEVQGYTDQIRALLKKEGSVAEKRAIKKTLKTFTATEKKAMKKFAEKTVQEKVDEAFNLLTARESMFGMIPDELLSQSKHFKHRGIDLKGFETDTTIQKFLNHDDQFNRTQYVLGFGRQVALREKFLPIMNRAGRGNIELDHRDFVKALQDEAMSGFERDQAALGRRAAQGEDVSKLQAQLNKDEAEADRYITRAMQEILRTDVIDSSPLSHGISNAMMAGTSASVLGQVLASMLGDTAMMTLAGGQFGTGWKSFFRGLRKRGILKEIAETDPELAHHLRAPHVMDQGFMLARFGADAEEYMIPGGWMSKITRVVSDVARKEGWMSGMHAWNRHLRSAFNVDFAAQIVRHAEGGWDNLDKNLRVFYRRQGWGPEQFASFADSMRRGGRTIRNGTVRIPDSAAFARNGDEADLRGFLRLLRAAGDEALLDPQIGDRPFLKSSPYGRLVLQFSSFMYTAAERYWIPLVQAGIIDPKNGMRVAMSATFALVLAGVGNQLRAYNRGEGEEYFDRILDGGQGTYEGLKEAFLRSPFTFGLMGTVMDISGVYAGGAINRGFQGATGSDFSPINTEWTKLRQDQGLAGMVPVLGTANTWLQSFGDAMDGDANALLRRSPYRIPLYNTLPLQVLARFNNQITGTPLLPGQKE